MSKTSPKPNILILGNDWSRMSDLISFGQKLNTNDDFEITFLLRKSSFKKRFPALSTFNTIVSPAKELANNICNIDASIWKKIKAKVYIHIQQIVLRYMRHSSFAEWFVYRHKLRLYQAEINHAKELRENFDAVLCFSDTGHECCIGYLHAFKNHLPIISIMLLNAAPEVLTVARQKNRSLEIGVFSPFISHLARIVAPENNLHFQGKTYLYHSPGSLAALKKIGIHAKNWFVRGTGDADIVCCDSQFDYDNSLRLGVDAKKLKIVGDFAYDELWEIHANKKKVKTELHSKYQLDPDKQLCLLALPQMAEHGYLDWDSHFDYIHQLIDICSHDNYELLLSLHPKMAEEKYQHLTEKFNCHILEERLFNVLPAVDIFLSKPSSTIRWGVMCNVNVIMFDFWDRFDTENYLHLESIDTVFKLSKLKKAFNQRSNQPQDHSKAHKLLSTESVFDGKVMQRYKKCIQLQLKN